MTSHLQMPNAQAPQRSTPASQSLILASASPRRRDLLQLIRITPDLVAPTEIAEAPLKGEQARQMALRLALEKATIAARRHPESFVVAADTVVAVGRRILGKAHTADEARRFLALLSGRRHRVFTGVAAIGPDGRQASRVSETVVTFKRLTPAEIDAYLASGEWRDKAGAYAIQGHAAAFIKTINGSYTNVVGLPLYETRALLEGLGYRPPVLNARNAPDSH